MPYPKRFHTTDVMLFVIVFFLLVSCHCSANNSDRSNSYLPEFCSDTLRIDLSSYKNGGVYIITDTIDLHGKTLYLPADVDLQMSGGVFKNGCVVGNNTRLKYKKPVFDRVHVKGTWIVPRITTSIFKDLSYYNSLKDVLALTNPEISNLVIIEYGRYWVEATETSSKCINVESNTELIINGTIALTANNLAGYNILSITGKNVAIYGTGCIIGDKKTHTGKDGEWGMGVSIEGGENVSIKGITIKDCWGDCIYIRRNSKDVVVEKCTLDNGRRQGISIISAQDVMIRNCTISNIKGTNPAYAIDIEPNQGDLVKKVTILNVNAINCRGGFECNGSVPNAEIDCVKIKNCFVVNTKRWPLRFIDAKSIIVDNCKIEGFGGEKVIYFKNINDAFVRKIAIDGVRMKQKEKILKSISTEEVHQLRVYK